MIDTSIQDLVADHLSLSKLMNAGMRCFENEQSFSVTYLNVKSQRKMRLLQFVASNASFPTINQFSERIQIALCALLNGLPLLLLGTFSQNAAEKDWRVVIQTNDKHDLKIIFHAAR